MNDEYVKVVFSTRRLVWIDDEKAGYTNTVFQIETGHHKFTLGPYKNYLPEEQWFEVTGTLPSDPLTIVFTRKEDDQ